MIKFEEYLEQFQSTISLYDFVVGLILTTILAILIRLFYIHFGDAISNRQRFANNFLPLALSTMLIITIVKSSIALSLGLVGALSIVRFRAAIKDPEELTYLFLTIGLGLCMGANQFLIGLIAIPAILLVLFLHKKFTRSNSKKQTGRMYLNVDTSSNDLETITNVISAELPFVELKRMDATDDGLSLSFIVKAESLDKINIVREKVIAIAKDTRISFVEQPDLIL